MRTATVVETPADAHKRHGRLRAPGDEEVRAGQLGRQRCTAGLMVRIALSSAASLRRGTAAERSGFSKKTRRGPEGGSFGRMVSVIAGDM